MNTPSAGIKGRLIASLKLSEIPPSTAASNEEKRMYCTYIGSCRKVDMGGLGEREGGGRGDGQGGFSCVCSGVSGF